MMTIESINREHERNMAEIAAKAEERKPLIDAVVMAAASGSNDNLRAALEALKSNKGL